MEETKTGVSDTVSGLFEKRKELMEQYYEALDALGELNDDNLCKLGVSDGKLYRSWSWASGIQRNFRGESRKTTIDHISNCVTDVLGVYDSIFVSLSDTREHTFDARTDYAKVLVETKKHMCRWRDGLASMSKLYHGDRDSLSTIDDISASLTVRIERTFTISFS